MILRPDYVNASMLENVVCRDPLASGNDNGIEIVNIVDFLHRNEW